MLSEITNLPIASIVAFLGISALLGVVGASLLGAFESRGERRVMKQECGRTPPASTHRNRDYLAEYVECCEGERGHLECKAALMEAARVIEGEERAREIAHAIDEYNRTVNQHAKATAAIQGSEAD